MMLSFICLESDDDDDDMDMVVMLLSSSPLMSLLLSMMGGGVDKVATIGNPDPTTEYQVFLPPTEHGSGMSLASLTNVPRITSTWSLLLTSSVVLPSLPFPSSLPLSLMASLCPFPIEDDVVAIVIAVVVVDSVAAVSAAAANDGSGSTSTCRDASQRSPAIHRRTSTVNSNVTDPPTTSLYSVPDGPGGTITEQRPMHRCDWEHCDCDDCDCDCDDCDGGG
mmetsp:Transcript_17882/g.50702  ORF Transcript_17882/g.50702 Transcript_17882/m.50702 type:complete len:222 (-) Transcript_17882:1983-2648(-)